jgi:hypothetical protein
MADPKTNLRPAWQPGQSGNPAGRSKGSRHKLGEAFLTKLYDDFMQHGVKVIEKVRATRPDIYLKVVAATLPRELHFKNESAFDGMSNEQLDEIAGAIRSVIATRAPAGLGEGAAQASSKDKSDKLH